MSSIIEIARQESRALLGAIGLCVLPFFACSLLVTMAFLHFDVIQFSRIWLFNAVFTNFLVNAFLLIGFCTLFIKAKKKQLIKDLAYAFAISVLFHTSLFGVVIVSFDRSISVYFLSSMYEADSPQSYQELEKLLWEGYFVRHDATHQRLTEQLIIGNIQELEGSEYTLSNEGRRFVENSRIIAGLYNVRRDFLWPHVISTDPTSLAGTERE